MSEVHISQLAEVDPVLPDDLLQIQRLTLPIAQQDRRAQVQNFFRAGRTLYVDAVYGNDTAAKREYGWAPFKTITAAKNAAVSGDLVVVRPGTYNENNLMKAGVAYDFCAGAKVLFTDAGALTTSTTSVAIGLGSKSLVVANSAVALKAGDPVWIALQPNTTDPDNGGADFKNFNMAGTVTSFAGGTLVVNVTGKNGGGTYAAWLVFGPNWGIFDDRAPGASGDCVVSGALEMSYVTPNPPNLMQQPAAVVSTLATTRLNLSALKLTVGSAQTVYALYLQVVKDGSFVAIDHIVDDGTSWSNLDATGPLFLPGVTSGCYWETGELHLKLGRVEMAGPYGLWCHEPAAGATTDCYCHVQYMKCGGTCFYTDNVSSNYRVWLSALQLVGKGLGISMIGGSGVGARIYVDAQKIIADQAVSVQSGGTLWLRAEKLATGGNSGKWISVGGGSIVYATVQEYEDTGAGYVVNGIDVSGASSYVVINGGRIKTGSAASGNGAVRHVGGVTKVIGATIDGSANNLSTNRPVVVAGAGLSLQGCVILAGASADSSLYAASAQTVKLYNNSYSNVAKHANVTLQANLGTLVVDAAVTA